MQVFNSDTRDVRMLKGKIQAHSPCTEEFDLDADAAIDDGHSYQEC